MDSTSSQALLEVSSTSPKRNSPNMTQLTNNTFNCDSSPFQSSPLNTSIDGKSSPRLYWRGRDPVTPNRLNIENHFLDREFSPSPTRRSSIEKLQKASRVKNSNMFAREQKLEYDPTSVPLIERPLIKTLQGNTFAGLSRNGYRDNGQFYSPGLNDNDSKRNLPRTPQHNPHSNLAKTIQKLGLNSVNSPKREHLSPTKSSISATRSQSKEQLSPTKSSLSASRPKSSFSSDTAPRFDYLSPVERKLPPGKTLHRHTKSVTFDAAPPQVNEYEMATPDLSSIDTESRENSYDSMEDDHNHFTYDDSLEQDNSFDASLEDTAKTPVVGPDDWSNESPDDHVHKFMTGKIDDPFDELSNESIKQQSSPLLMSWSKRKNTTSSKLNAEQRPLPPIPKALRIDKNINISLSPEIPSLAERSQCQDSPQEKLVKKADATNLAGTEMTLEERLNLMMIQDEEILSNKFENQRERRMRRAGARDLKSQTPEQESSPSFHKDEHTPDQFSALGTYQLPHRISRESILRKVKGKLSDRNESQYNFSSPIFNSSQDQLFYLDPDIPIPTTEIEDKDDEAEEDARIKHDSDEESDITAYELPEHSLEPSHEQEEQDDEDEKPRHSSIESESQYSDDMLAQNPYPEQKIIESKDTSIADSEIGKIDTQSKEINSNDIEELKTDLKFSGLDIDKFRLSLKIEPLSEIFENNSDSTTHSTVETHTQSPITEESVKEYIPPTSIEKENSNNSPEESYESEGGTPESVIHYEVFAPSPCESPSIPDQIATIKSGSGSCKLKTRPSATSADLEAMRDSRKKTDDEIPPVPPIPGRHQNRPMSVDRGIMQKYEEMADRQSSFKRSLTLDLNNDVCFDLENDFERVLQAQKRGYLTRQNTKIVIASSENDLNDKFNDDHTRSAGNSPVKHNRTQSWVVEPWIGQTRKDGGRKSGILDQNLPSSNNRQESKRNFSGISGLSDLSILEDGSERGRLFVKVLGVKDLNLPLPRNEKTWFSLTLDNGVHCVTTAWLELGRNAPIGQEFELIVPNDLEFQLTLHVKLVKPLPKKVTESTCNGFKVPKPSTFSRVFISKKRKELEARKREEEQQYTKQRELESSKTKLFSEPSAWDLLSPFTSEDGSFARSYICLKDHEERCFGRPCIVEASCFNEWAIERVNKPSSVMSKRSSSYVQRRAPYKVAKLELQLLFVPKPKGATDDDMPKSMNSCLREMREAEKALALQWEGHLSQQGGDCPYWRRRYFKLTGSKLTAYHESTRQPRVTINLGNACKLIDDRSILTQKETTSRGGKRRKSGFAEDEEGYMFVEEGFRIRFNNGEVIDFYADSPSEKEAWMKALEKCVGNEGEVIRKGWCNLVIKREQIIRRQAARNKQT